MLTTTAGSWKKAALFFNRRRKNHKPRTRDCPLLIAGWWPTSYFISERQRPY